MVDVWSNPDVTAQGFKFVLVQVEDSAGAMQGKGAGGIPLQAETTTKVQHYGFSSTPKGDTEMVGFTLRDGSIVSLGENVDHTKPPDGHSELWDDAGNSVVCKDDDGGVELTARSGQSVTTLSPTLLGSLAAAEKLVKGTTQKTALSTFFIAWQAALTPMKAHTDPIISAYANAVGGALATLQATESTWESTKHKLDV